MNIDLKTLISLRQALETIPEHSGQEIQTSACIEAFLANCPPDRLRKDIGGTGILALYVGRERGPFTLIRCDMDAVPMADGNPRHTCGHDGHMAMAAGLCLELSANRPQHGTVGILFQPGEENGTGAAAVLEDPGFQDISPDLVFALHNLPGYPLGTLLVPSGQACCASCGMTIDLSGAPAHASMPETGISPAMALSELMRTLQNLPHHVSLSRRFAMVTLIHASMGEPAFGVAPSRARLMATLRAESDSTMDTLLSLATEAARAAATEHDLHVEISLSDTFPATRNHPAAISHLFQAAETMNLSLISPTTPFRWSEDFGHFTAQWPGALFCMGAGEDQPQLHTASYRFPDRLLETGVRFWIHLVETIHAHP